MQKFTVKTSILCQKQHMYRNAIPQDSVTPGAPIDIKIVASTPGYPDELNHHNVLTFSQWAAPGHLVFAEDRHQPVYKNNG